MYVDKVIKNTFFTEVNGVKIRVYDSLREGFEYDTPLTLVFLHGLPGQISNWRYQLDYFKKLYRTVAYDQRGFGMSDKPKKVELKDFLKDLDAILEKLGIPVENAVLIGHSFGGLVAQTYACGKDLKGLVLIGSVAWKRASFIDKFIWYMPSIFWHRLFFTENRFTRKMYRELFFSPSTSQEIFEQFMKDNKEYIESLPAHVFRYDKCYRDYDASKILNNIKCPTLIIVGEHDKVTPPEHSKKLHQLIPNSKLEIVKDAGHLILYEKPSELNRMIHEFISKL